MCTTPKTPTPHKTHVNPNNPLSKGPPKISKILINVRFELLELDL